MRYFILLLMITLLCIGIANAFSNSLDGSNLNQPLPQNNNFSVPNAKTYQNNVNKPFIPKVYSGFEHNNSEYSNPQMNDARYNSNCQFGQCIPGGLNTGNR